MLWKYTPQHTLFCENLTNICCSYFVLIFYTCLKNAEYIIYTVIKSSQLIVFIKSRKDLKAMKFSKKKIITISVVALIAVSVVAAAAVNSVKGGKKNMSDMNETDEVTRGNIDETITGSASIEPYERYEIVALVSGDIVSSPFEEGDTVKKGDLLYKFDTSSVNLGIQKQELNLKQSQNSYNNAVRDAQKLNVTAPCDGVVSGITAKAGNDASPSTVLAKVENTYELKVDLPFNSSQISRISVGDTATISSSSHMSGVTGRVTHIAANPTAQSDGAVLYDVTIKMNNPGSFTSGLVVGGEISGMVSPGSGTIECEDVQNVMPEVSGKVGKIYVSNGDYVHKGDTIMTLTSDTISDNIKNSDIQYKSSGLSLQESKDSLDDYSLTSPINGTVITKNKKAGDTVDRNTSTQTLMVVADISKLKFSLSIDELDVSKVAVGQEVRVTCDALEGEEYVGHITNVSVEGTSTNGVTVYNADVVVEEPGNLRPSMNVDATVVFASSEDTLIVPSGDIKTVMGKSYVFVESDKAKTSDKKDKKDNKKDKSEDMPVVGLDDENGDKTPEGGAPQGNESGKMPEAPDGYETVEIQTGLSNDEYTEVLSGLKEGDRIYRMTTSSNSSDMFMGGMDFGGGEMGGGPQGGGAPRGGGPGGGMGGGMR